MITEPFSQFRKDIIENLSFSGVLFWFVFLPIIVLLLLLAYDDLTNNFFLSKIDRKTTILKQLYEMEQGGITQSENLNPIYNRTIAELTSYNIERPAVFRFISQKLTIAFFTGLPLGLLISLAASLRRSGKDKSTMKLISVFGLGVALAGGGIAVIVTTLSNLQAGIITVVALQSGLIAYVLGLALRETIKNYKAAGARARNTPLPGKKNRL